MNFRDAQMSDITVVLDKRWEHQLDDAVEQLKREGMNVQDARDENGVVDGVIETRKVQDLQKLDCVDYVRTTFTWIADYPPGDPRDLDRVAQESDD
jgi:hypothetical protein